MKQPPCRSRSIALLIIDIQNNVFQILDKTIDILTAEAEVQDESERAAETLSVLQVGVGTGVHYEKFREFGLRESSLLSSLGKALGKVVWQEICIGTS